MNFPRVPMQFVAGIAEFSDLVISIEILRGRAKRDAAAVAQTIPAVLRQAACFLDRITGRWLYDFGDPVTTEHGHAYGVGKTWHKLTTLIDVVECARIRLTQPVFADYLTRLADPKKHVDMLFEFAPVLRLDPEATAEYEVTGQSPGNKKIDWKITGPNGFGVLLEVKSREADLIRSFERVEAGERDADGAVPAPDHDTDLLFRSIEAKFLSRPPNQLLQGAWIGSALMQECSELEQSFLRLDPSKIHFAILGGWDGAVYLLTRDGVPRETICELLCVCEVDRLVFKRTIAG